MRIRYPDDLEITTLYPDPAEVDGITVPPLLLVTFIENAFKHGISYDSRSYIRSELSMADGRLTYSVRNSLHLPLQEPGVGLDNLRKRLGLLYGESHALSIEITENEYIAELILPATHGHEMHSH